jgi:hypothetical protein
MRSLPTSSKQIAWNKLVVAIGTLALVWLIASAIALLAVAILVSQWIAWERTIAENEEQLRSASEAIFQTPAEPLAELTPKTQPTDPALKSQWEEILSQLQHPYFKNQIDLFFQEPYHQCVENSGTVPTNTREILGDCPHKYSGNTQGLSPS